MYAVNVTMTKLADFLYITTYLQELLTAIQYISVLRVQGRTQNLLQAFQAGNAAEAEVRELPIDFWFQDQCDSWSHPENRLLLLRL